MAENPNPLVSVIMPVYNCAQYVDEAIESIVNQTYTNMEIFIIDDCSTDGTKEKVESWVKLDKRIKPIYKSANSGYVDSLNMSICLSNGEYIARMDGDDISLPERIERQVEYMINNVQVGVLGSGYRYLGTNKTFIPVTEHDKIKIGLLSESQIAHPTVMYRAGLLKKLNRLYKTEFMPCEDYEFWIYLSSVTRLHNLEDVLLNYRVHGDNISTKIDNYDLLRKINQIQLEKLGLNNYESRIVDLKNLLNKKLKYKKSTDLIIKIDILKKISKNNRKLQIYNIFLLESLINDSIKIKKRHKLLIVVFLRLYVKISFINFKKSVNVHFENFTYKIEVMENS